MCVHRKHKKELLVTWPKTDESQKDQFSISDGLGTQMTIITNRSFVGLVWFGHAGVWFERRFIWPLLLLLAAWAGLAVPVHKLMYLVHFTYEMVGD